MDYYDILYILASMLFIFLWFSIGQLIKQLFFGYDSGRDQILWFIPYAFGYVFIFTFLITKHDVIIEEAKAIISSFGMVS